MCCTTSREEWSGPLTLKEDGGHFGVGSAGLGFPGHRLGEEFSVQYVYLGVPSRSTPMEGRDGNGTDGGQSRAVNADPDPPHKALRSSGAFRRPQVVRLLYPPMDNQSQDAGCPHMADGCSRTCPCSRGHQSFVDGDPG